MAERVNHFVAVTGPGQAELRAEPIEAAALGADEVEGATLVTLISAGTELAGCYAPAGEREYPARPGYAAVVRVAAVGAEVSDVAPGDVVFCMGRHQSWQRHRRNRVVPGPAGPSPEAAALARMMGVSMSTLTTTTARPPGRALVTGLGPVGHLAAKIFSACGYRVTAVDPLADRRELLRAGGVGDVREAVPVAAAGGFDLAVECSGHEQAVLDACRAVRKRGEVVLVGVPWSRQADLQAFEVLREVFHRYVVLRSGWEWEVPHDATDFRVNSLFGNFAVGLDWLAEGRIAVDGLYHAVPPARCQEAYQALLARRAPKLTTLFDWRDGVAGR